MENGFPFTAFLPFVLFMIPIAIGNYFLADRMGQNKILWVVLTIIPIMNFIFIYYVMYVVVLYVLDKLNKLTDRLERFCEACGRHMSVDIVVTKFSRTG